MFKTSIEQIVPIIMLLCLSCGEKGRPSELPPATNSADPVAPRSPGALDQKTKVNFDTLPYNLAIDNDPACQSTEQGHGLFDLKGYFSKIPNWSELPSLDLWPKQSLDLTDLIGDSKGHYDLSQIGIGFWEGDLLIKWKGSINKESSFIWEFGFYTSRQNGILRSAKTYFLVSDSGLTKFSNGSKTELKPPTAQISEADGFTTLRFPLNEIENITTYPLWWVRGILKQGGGSGNQLDTTQAAVLKSYLNPDVMLFSVEKCHLNLPPPYDLWVEVLKDNATITDDATTTFLKDKFFSSYRNFVAYVFQRNQIVPSQIASFPIFHITTKEIAPVEGILKSDALKVDENENLTHATLGWTINAKSLFNDTDSNPDATLQQGLSEVISKQFLTEAWIDAPKDHLELGKDFLSLKWATNLFGNRYWIEYVANLSETQPNLKKAAALLGESLGMGDFLEAWSNMSHLNAPLSEGDLSPITLKFSDQLADFLPTFDRNIPLLNGWLLSGPYNPKMDRALLEDTDDDGLPLFLELKLGTDPLTADTDQDHWIDATEWLLGTSPLNQSDTPNTIIADGNFGDWQRLMPRRINIDRVKSGHCSKKADIELFAALAKSDSLIIGAYASEFWVNDKEAQWEVDLDITAKKKRYLLSAPSGSHNIFLDSIIGGEGNMPLQRKAHKIFTIGFGFPQRVFEFALNSRDLELPGNLTNPEAIRIRIRTRYPATNPEYCDETQWFQPVIHSD